MDEVNRGDAAGVEILLNGKPRRIPAHSSVSALIASLELQDRLVVVERNGEVMARAEFASTELVGGDTLEIVHFVGGG
jgi:sulfur carrier protein